MPESINSGSNKSTQKEKLPRNPKLSDAQLDELIDDIPKPPRTKCQAQLHQLGGSVTVEVEEEELEYIVPDEEISSDDEVDRWNDDRFIAHPYPKHRTPRGPTTKFSNERTQPTESARFYSTSTARSGLTLVFEAEGVSDSSVTTPSTRSRSSTLSKEVGTASAMGKEKVKYEEGVGNSSRGSVKCKTPLRRWFGASQDST